MGGGRAYLLLLLLHHCRLSQSQLTRGRKLPSTSDRQTAASEHDCLGQPGLVTEREDFAGGPGVVVDFCNRIHHPTKCG